MKTLLQILGLLTADNSDENAIKTGKKVYKILTSTIYKKYFKDFEFLEDFNNCVGLDDFNGTLELFYDYCDENLIWIDFE
jgi:hypothetical protein